MFRNLQGSLSFCNVLYKRNLCSKSYKPVLAIRRETINLWERRAPLSPIQVAKVVKDGVRVLIQPSNRRAYLSQEYQAAGAEITEDLNEATLIIGVKKPSGLEIEDLLPNKTYAFFTHTIKAQPDNMALLDVLLERKIRIIDYERMLNNQGQRVLAFGQYAGIAGMINILHGMGLRLLALGHTNPFLHIGLAHNYRSVEQARQAVRDAGYEIALGKMPQNMGPVVFVFTGSGNVSMGGQYICKCLPIEYISPSELKHVSEHGNPKKIYVCVVSRQDHYERRKMGGFDSEEFDMHPERYISTFSTKIAPYATCIINGIYYAPGSPRILTISDAKHLLTPNTHKSEPGMPLLPHRLISICDISADPGGSIEFMQECTTIDKPFCLYDAEQNQNDESFTGSGVLVCSVDNMPAQIPREATNYFGNLMLPHLVDMLKSNALTSFEDWNAGPIVKNATITSNGHLTDNYKYIMDLRKKNAMTSANIIRNAKKNVLILGSGYIVPSIIEYLCRDPEISITVASDSTNELKSICSQFKNVRSEGFDIINKMERLNELSKNQNLIISMLPWKHHPLIADICIKNKVNMLTASYCTPVLAKMKEKFEDAGITAMMEIGLDPGIDHLLAMECFDEIREKGGVIERYESYTGGIPSPECSDNPLRYKFSWSPEAALLTVQNGAKFLKNGKIVEIPAGGDLMNAAQKMTVYPGYNLEGYPNRDSTVYSKLYGLYDAKTVIRGTLRYEGYCRIMKGLLKLGLLDTNKNDLLASNASQLTWKQLVCKLNVIDEDKPLKVIDETLIEQTGIETFKKIKKLKLFSDEHVPKSGSTLSSVANFLSETLSYVVYGNPAKGRAGLAMSRTVGLPTAIAARMILNGEIKNNGIVLPLSSEIYRPILRRLKKEGIFASESSEERV